MDIWRDDLLTDSFNKIWSCFSNLAGLFVSLKDRTVRVSADYSDLRILFLQKSSGTRDCSAGAQASNKVGYLAFGLFPDFWSSSEVMGPGIGWIRILIRVEGIRCLSRNSAGCGNIMIWSTGFCRDRRDHYVSAKCLQVARLLH